MKRESLIARLRSLKPQLKSRYGIEEIALFGSFARDEAKEESDIDIAILKIGHKDFFLRMEARRFLEERLGKKVDLGYFDTIRPIVKGEVVKDLTIV